MKKLVFPFVLLLAASVIFTGCRSNDDPTTEYIVVDNNETLYQTVYADEEAGESGVRITTLAPWTSSIREATATSSTRNTADWVSISPDRGNAGTYTIMITLEPNFSGNYRSAIIAIISGTTTIEIRITQQGETEEGYVPVNPEDHSIIRAENIEGDFNDVVTVKVYKGEGTEGDIILAKAPFVNNGFTLHLPQIISDNYLFPIREWFEFFDDFTISDENAKWLLTDDEPVVAYDKEGNHIGSFFYAEVEDDMFNLALWIYTDRDVVIKANVVYFVDEWDSWDLNLRKGWNIIYVNVILPNMGRKTTITSQKPTDANLRWMFQSRDFEDWASRSANTRATENRRSVLRR